ncbi:hypothetical protein [Tepidiforma sp.]|uniref:hypothetical protein n=1 Tax=Tepidiforma sp. TaxID=2682230 RepID=UPI002ADD556A|nr:hypothetical protein [Tepidiforma sp.]
MRDWLTKVQPMPRQRVELPYSREFSPEELRALARGLLPEDFDDRWVGLLREGSIDFHRSWTGYHIHHLPLERGPGVAGAVATKLVVNRDPRQYRNTDPQRDLEQVEWLLRWMLSGERHPPPWPLHQAG